MFSISYPLLFVLKTLFAIYKQKAERFISQDLYIIFIANIIFASFDSFFLIFIQSLEYNPLLSSSLDTECLKKLISIHT